MPRAKAAKSLRLFAEKVLPAVQAMPTPMNPTRVGRSPPFSISRSLSLVFFSREKSTSANPGPVIALRERFPKLFVVFTKAHPGTGPLAGHNLIRLP